MKPKPVKLLYNRCTAPNSPFELVLYDVRTRVKGAPHTHDFAELFWIKEGRCLHVLNGRSMEISTNDFFIVKPSDCHSFEMADDIGYKLVNLAFGSDALPRIARRYKLPDDSPWRLKSDSLRNIHLSPEDGAWLDSELKRLRARPPTILSLDGFLISLMLRLNDKSADPFAALPGWLQDASAAMSRPENFRHGARRFAELAGRSPAHVSRLLKERTGRSPIQWVSEWRMAYAAERLESSQMPVDEIASSCGFSSKSRFHKLFLERFKLSPHRYRMRQHSKFPTR